jgi:hypothetical protein
MRDPAAGRFRATPLLWGNLVLDICLYTNVVVA